ncbi:phosphoribosylformylglycinamidine cyclo-ligase [Nitrospirota bacterium]|nr:phosphoribosylformylglycinamidine cyclo-ligase [Nitrospirota bacterium]
MIGLASTGLHSNGYSLARRVLLDQAQLSMTSRLPELDRPLGEVLLTPTRIYAKQVLTLIQDCPIKGIAHITGGGITENLPRVFPAGIGAQVQRSAWSVPPIFQAIARLGQVERAEMYRVFNMGIGMILVVPASDAPTVIARARALSDQAYQIGTIVASTGDGPLVEYVD